MIPSPNNDTGGMDKLSEAVASASSSSSKDRKKNNDSDMHISSHSGLSALLSAVSLQMTTEGASSTASGGGAVETDNSSTEDGTTGVAKLPASETTPPMMSENAKNASTNFPETLMTVSMDPDNSNVITWLPDGKYFCLREDLFREQVLPRHFPGLRVFDRFLQELCKWGFTMIDTKRPGIEVFRHPLFRKGDWKRCQRLKYDEQMTVRSLERKTSYDSGPSSASPSPTPPLDHNNNDHHPRPSSSDGLKTTTPTSSIDPRTAALIAMRSASLPNISTSKDTTNDRHPHDELVLQQRRTSSADSFKRRLSPTHQESMEELEAPASFKQRRDSVTGRSGDLRPRSQSDDFHGMVRNITTEKLQLPVTDAAANTNNNITSNTSIVTANNSSCNKNTNSTYKKSPTTASTDNDEFVAQAVRGATHSIVTDAIEALLRDEAHTQKVFQANAEELSKSSLPGLVPISQELFSTTTPPSRRASSASVGATRGGNGSSATSSSSSSRRRASDTIIRRSTTNNNNKSSPRITSSPSVVTSSPKPSPTSSAKSSPTLLRGKLPARKAMLMKAMREHSESEASSHDGANSP